MANEISVQTSMTIRKGNLYYQSRPTGFTANMTGSNGPVPGFINVPLKGVSISFSSLALLGGMCRIQNSDPSDGRTSFLEYGVFDPDTNEFYPFGEALPGESYVFRLSRYLGQEFGPHTGTTIINDGVTLYLKAVGQGVGAIVEAFDA